MRKGNKAAIALIQRKGGLTTTDPKMLDFFQVTAHSAAQQACVERASAPRPTVPHRPQPKASWHLAPRSATCREACPPVVALHARTHVRTDAHAHVRANARAHTHTHTCMWAAVDRRLARLRRSLGGSARLRRSLGAHPCARFWWPHVCRRICGLLLTGGCGWLSQVVWQRGVHQSAARGSAVRYAGEPQRSGLMLMSSP